MAAEERAFFIHQKNDPFILPLRSLRLFPLCVLCEKKISRKERKGFRKGRQGKQSMLFSPISN